MIAYELDRLFRAERHPPQAGWNYSRAEVGRILLAATGRQGISTEDRAYLVRLVAAETGAAPPDAERRAHAAITAATTGAKARRSALILGFCTAASLLAGAAAAWYGACAGGRHRDEVVPPLS